MTAAAMGALAAGGLVVAVSPRLPRRPRNLLWLAGSYALVLAVSPTFAVILAAVTAADFGLGFLVGRSARPGRWLAAGVAFNVAVLLAFKLAGFYVREAAGLAARLGIGAGTGGLGLLLPIGLSYYVLQAVSYLVDVRRRQTPVCADPADFALYMAFLPKLAAGPIERAGAFLPQLARARAPRLAGGGGLIVLGLFRKVVLADPLLGSLPAGWAAGSAVTSFPEAAAGLVVFACGLYNDFAGYTDIARGTGRLLGIDLSRNFDLPFFARTLSEFWSRWHMSLSSWIRDYVYLPAARALIRRDPSGRSIAAAALPPLAAMMASGLWHGPQARYLVWGGLMGAWMAGERLAAVRRPIGPPGAKPLAARVASRALFLAVVAGLFSVFALGVPAALRVAADAFNPAAWRWPGSRALWLLVPAMALEVAQLRARPGLPFERWREGPRTAAVAAALLAILFFSQSRLVRPFIYQGF